MPHYAPPLRDTRFVLHELLDVTSAFRSLPAHSGLDLDVIDALLDEAGKFAAAEVHPLNQRGDAEGCSYDRESHAVRTPTGYRQAYEQYVTAGWPSLSADPAYGGQGLPTTLGQCVFEFLNSASQAWTMYPGLSHGAYECLHAHGSDDQKRLYLPRLTSGEWCGTMCLTEAHCGTDLGLIRTRAEPQDDGSVRISGEKIFISAGEHDLSANIVHLVLARLPDAPAGSKGISLFVVPKFLVLPDGTLGARNGVHCAGIEH
jgi:alkylation response protein AidB-like acyl-CoA dehydrogenase